MERWTSHFTVERSQHLSDASPEGLAFNEFKRLYNALETLANLTFVIAAIRMNALPSVSWMVVHWPQAVAVALIGCMLISISIWAADEIYSVLGDVGTFCCTRTLCGNTGWSTVWLVLRRLFHAPRGACECSASVPL